MSRRSGLALIIGLAIAAAVGGALVVWSAAEPERDERQHQADLHRTYRATLATQLEVLKEWRVHDREADDRTPFYFLWAAGMFKQYALKGYPSLRDLTIVEIGPGSAMIIGALYISAGAKRYYGVDIYEHPRLTDALPYRVAFALAYMDPDYLVRDRSEIIVKEVAGKAVFDPERMTFLKRPSHDTGLPDASVDYLFSLVTLEHIYEVEKSILEWKRVLKPGGVSAHFAVMADHRDFTKPYEYLKLDHAAWRAQFVGPNARHPENEYVNPWRPVDFKRAFEKAGFEILEYSTEPRQPYVKEQAQVLYPNRAISDADWAEINPSVRRGHTREEVSELFVTLVARKR